jgi:hypothetical protein
VPHKVDDKRRLASTPKNDGRMGSGPQHSQLLLSTGVLNPIGTGNAGVRSECNARYSELATSSMSAHAMSSTKENRVSVGVSRGLGFSGTDGIYPRCNKVVTVIITRN